MSKIKKKKIPKFKSIEEESDFWDTHSPLEYGEWKDVTDEFWKDIKLHAQPKKKITLRLDIPLLNKLKKIAKKHEMPYQKLTRELIRTGVSKIIL